MPRADFEVGQPAITGFHGDGNQTAFSLDANGTGSLHWIIIPQRASTLQGPTQYYVGGSLLCDAHRMSCVGTQTSVRIALGVRHWIVNSTA